MDVTCVCGNPNCFHWETVVLNDLRHTVLLIILGAVFFAFAATCYIWIKVSLFVLLLVFLVINAMKSENSRDDDFQKGVKEIQSTVLACVIQSVSGG